MADHTPAPWVAEQEVKIDGGVRCVNRRAGPVVVPCNFPEGTPEGDRADADLRLTAAAPDLLEAARLMLAALSYGVLDCDVRAAERDLAAAVAKAEGLPVV